MSEEAKQAPQPELPRVKRYDEKSFDSDDEEDIVHSDRPLPSVARRYGKKVTVFVNGEKHVLSNVSPHQRLVGFLRRSGLTGTQTGCGEGGCGACTVVVSSADPKTGKPIHRTLNSCMTLLCSVDGCEVTSVEGVGSKRTGYHAVQQRLAQAGGSQCGFCTAGFIGTMYGLLLNDPEPSPDDVENCFQGNLCRCTGYRPILRAAQSFAQHDEELSSLGEVDKTAGSKVLSAPLRYPQPRTLGLSAGWYRPIDLGDVYKLLDNFKDVPTKLVVGNTSVGVAPKYPPVSRSMTSPDVYIDVARVSDLKQIRIDDGGVNIGSSVTLKNVIDVLEACNAKEPVKCGHFEDMAKNLREVATPQVRNVASWAGNLMIAKHHPVFPSDVVRMFEAANAQITLSTAESTRCLSVSELMAAELAHNEIILSVQLPYFGDNTSFRTFHVSARRQNAHSIVNAGFRFDLDENKLVQGAHISFGGVAPGTCRIRKAEEFLAGKPLISQTLKKTINLISEEVKEAESLPSDRLLLHSEEYRQKLAVNLFYKFFLSLQEHLPPNLQSATERSNRPLSKGTQVFKADENLSPISDPVPKIEGLAQASGELCYTSDLKNPPGGLFGVPLQSTKPNSPILSIDASKALQMDGVVDFLTAKDIYDLGGRNEVGLCENDYPVFAEGAVMFVGQQIGMVICTSAGIGHRACRVIDVEYGEPAEAPVLSLADAMARGSIHDQTEERFSKGLIPLKFQDKMHRGDIEKGFVDAQHIVEGEVHTSGQEHFYMETQSCAVFPGDNKLEVYVACQSPGFNRNVLASVCNLPSNKINVIAQRAGGAFGGKFMPSLPNAAACAVAALKHNQPVRCRYTRKQDMTLTAKRDPLLCTYKVGFNDDGTITALQMKYHQDAGCAFDISMICMWVTQRDGDNVYNIENYETTGAVYKTNLPSNTAMRAPGHTSSVYFIENIMEVVSQHTGVDPAVVREKHFYKIGDHTPLPDDFEITDCTIPEVWSKVKEQGRYEQVRDEVEEFNELNKWKKRGVSIVPIKYALGWGGKKMSALVNVCENDGTVSVTSSGVEMGQGLNTKVAQAVAYRFGIPIEKVSINTPTTDISPNTGITGGSTTSEACVKAAVDACDEINGKLQKIKEEMKDASWPEIIQKAGATNTMLSATGWFCPGSGSYYVWSAAVNVAEVDILTGETTILSTEIVYDCGQSLNPNIDIGQVEGGFIQGLGMYALEETKVNDKGVLVNSNPWDYHLPDSQSIPINFNVTFLDKKFGDGVLGSKASGEPSVLLSCGVLFAIQNAVRAARAEIGGDDKPFTRGAPFTVEEATLESKVGSEHLTLDI